MNPVSVSVLMATRNDLATLPMALRTFLASRAGVEIVIVNDGSSDGTREYLDSLAHPGIKALHLSESVGLTRALNLAIEHSRGALLARQDADDASHPDRLTAQLEAFRNDPALDILGTGHRILDGNGAEIARLEGRNYPNPAKRLAAGNYFCHGSLMMKRESLSKLGGYREFFRFSQDYDLLLRAAAAGMRLRNLKDCLYDWTFSPNAISARKSREQARYAATARSVSEDSGRDPETIYRSLESREGIGADAVPVPGEWQLMKIMLRSGNTAGARRQYAEMRRKGIAPPDDSVSALLRFIPGWLYRPLRSLADLRYL